LLRELDTAFATSPRALAPLWPPYVASVLAVGGGTLSSDDLSDLEARGAVLAKASSGELGLADAWSTLIAARYARGEHDTACARMATLYWWADLPAASRAVLAGELAGRGADAPAYWAVYVEHLATAAEPAAEPAMTAILAGRLAVGFDVDPERLAVAGELAERLAAAGVDLPGVQRALGYARLLVADDPVTAAEHLERARLADPDDDVALVGLVAAWVRGAAHHRLSDISAEEKPPEVAEVAELGAVLGWLADPGVGGRCPATAARLAELPVAAQAGPWLAYARGRAHLLEGDATAAAELLGLASHPRHPEWRYHEAWARLLLGDREGVARCAAASAHWAHRWLLGCLLMEVDPGGAEQVAGELAAAGLPPVATATVATRLALARTGTATSTPDLPSGVPVEVVVEVLRTGLGAGLADGDMPAVAERLAHPAFTRLPLADQLLWTGLAEDDDALIEHAADALGYPRAALVLTVLRRDPSRLGRLSARTDPTVELLRAWADPDTAEARLADLADDPRVRYARGRLLLACSEFAAASTEFHTCAGNPNVPGDAAVLALATAFAADPDSRSELAGTPVGSDQTWLNWMIALAALAADPAAVDLTALDHLVAALSGVEAPSVEAVRVVAVGLAHARMTSRDRHRTDRLGALLQTLAQRTTDSEVRRLRELAAASAARHTPAAIGLTDTYAASALTTAEHALAEGEDARAVQALRATPADGSTESSFCHLAADIVAGDPVPNTGEMSAPDSPLGHAVRVLVAAATVEWDPDDAVRSLVPVLREHDLVGIVDLREALPRLLADAGRHRVPDHLARLVRRVIVTDERTDPLRAACQLTGIGDHAAADQLWRRALAEDSGVADEYAAVLRHRAVVARRDDDTLAAAGCLLLAGRVATGLDPMPTKKEYSRFHRAFWRTGRSRKDRRRSALRVEWRTTDRVLTTAQRAEAEDRVLLCFERLRRLAGEGPESEDVARACQLVLGLCIERLLGHLFPGAGGPDRTGRHRVLEDLVDRHGELLFALLDGGRVNVLRKWRLVLGEQSRVTAVHHALAVVHRERALADESAVDDLVVATGLWVLLLASRAFWARVGPAVREDQRALRADVARELLAAHSVRGGRALDAGAADWAHAHLRCLVACTTAAEDVVGLLDERDLPYRHAVEPEWFAEVAEVARRVLDGWVGDLLDTARKALTESAALIADTTGVGTDYAGALKVLEPFHALGVPVRAVLETGLAWYNEWGMSLYQLGDEAGLGEVVAAAMAWADPLLPLCDKSDVLAPVNSTLSRHLMLRGHTEEDPRRSRELLREAVAWDAGNSNAHDLLVDQLLDEVDRAIDDQRYDDALDALEAIGPADTDVELVKRRLATMARVLRARAAVDRERFAEAHADLVAALEIAPDRVIRDTVTVKLRLVEAMTAVTDEDWSALWRLVDNLVRQGDRDARAVLASGLNARAVAMADDSEVSERPYADAVNEVAAAVRERLPFTTGSVANGSQPRRRSGVDCAVCGTASCANRTAVIDDVVLLLLTGVFQATSAVAFWETYLARMCGSCSIGLRRLTARRTLATTLFIAAQRLDPADPNVRRNVELMREI